MNQFEYMPIVDEQKRTNLLKMAAESRRLSEAFPSDEPKKLPRQSKFLVMIRKELLYLRFSLESRINQRREMRLGLNPQNNPEGCN